MFGVCEGYDAVEAVYEGGLVGTTSNCLPLPLPVPFLLLLPLFVLLLLLLLLLSSAPLPGLQQSFTQCIVLPQFLQVLMSVVLVLLVRVPFLVLVFAFALLPSFLESVDLHPVVIIRTCSISSRHGRGCSKVSGRTTPLQQSCSMSGTVGVCTQLQTVPNKNRCHIHHHCVFDCICQSSS